MREVWDQYMRTQEKPWGWFMRDPVHANTRGKLVLGKILEAYFAPKSCER